jgi:hypothetical protein
MMPSGFSGEGFMWYEVERIQQRPRKFKQPDVEVVREYQGERVKVEVWRPEYSHLLDAGLLIVAYTALAIGAYKAMPAMIVGMSNLLGLNSAMSCGAL